MNSHFRRDYLYQFTDNHNGGMQEGAFLRYLRFDKTTKEYIFIEGRTRQPDELQLRILQTKSGYIGRRIKKVEYIGYEETDQYKLNKRIKKVRAVKRPSLTRPRVFVNHTSELVVGKKYKFSELRGGVFIETKKPLTLTDLNLESAHFEYQTMPYKWLDKGLLTLELLD